MLVNPTVPAYPVTKRPAPSRAVTTTLIAAPAVVAVGTVWTRKCVAGAGVSRRVIELALPLLTARSGKPSPLKSAAATQSGRSPTTYRVGAPNVPSPVPGKTHTVSAKLLTTARSSFPSPLKSVTAMPIGRESVSYSAFSPKLPVVPCWKIDRPGPKKVGTARSGLASALNRPMPTDAGSTSVAYEVGGPKFPCPSPNRVRIWLAWVPASTRSVLPSPLRSAAAT